ncbi:helix-turn-helix transcriptional regulator [Pseudorhodoferax sp.]|uniref:helix-turn-helix transcriptional regulator n=1 Tax=Pseudorhodoferax sp. TaxID=1993553 RepID=UPI0039E24364
MARAARLLALLQELRRHRRPVAGQALADALGVSLRTLYRDIATLQQQGAGIRGEAGVGYVLAPGYLLPPLMFTAEEVEALVLGMRWVAARGDDTLAAAARESMARIAAVLPDGLRRELEATTLLIGPGGAAEPGGVDLAQVRGAIRDGRKLAIDYRDAAGAASRRVVWPFGIGYFERVRIVLAWCELRQDLRHFRADRIAALQVLPERMPRHRLALLREWRARQRTLLTGSDSGRS